MSARPAGLVALLLVLAPAGAAGQEAGKLNVSQACFDSLPYGEAHTCEIVVISRNRIAPAALLTSLLQVVQADTLTVTARDSADDRVLVDLALQPPRGRCAVRFAGLDSLQPQVGAHFDAVRRGRTTGAALVVRSSVISAPGVEQDALALTLCVSAWFLQALAFPDLRR